MNETAYQRGRRETAEHFTLAGFLDDLGMIHVAIYQARNCGERSRRAYWLGVARELRAAR